jgi:voltage-gated potassium channel
MIFIGQTSAAAVLVMLTLSLQCAGMATLIAGARTSLALDIQKLGHLRSALLMVRFTTAIIALHIVEILLWAGFYRALCFPSWESAFYFSAASYATVGYGDVILPQLWRTLGPLESIIGVLMCGLSASFLFAIVTRLVEHEARSSDNPFTDTGDTNPGTRIRQSISRLSNANF